MKRIAYLDCFAGISGDMLLGALVDAGVPSRVLEDAAAALKIGASLRFERVDRSGISATKADVLEGNRLAELAGEPRETATIAAALVEQQHAEHLGLAFERETEAEPMPASLPEPEPEPEPAVELKRTAKPRPFSPFDHQRIAEPEPLSRQVETQHLHRVDPGEPHSHGHEHGHEHDHAHQHEHKHDSRAGHTAAGPAHADEHRHVHGRSLTEIRTLIEGASLEEPVKLLALRAFELLGASEAKIHNVPIDNIHFHEVGAVDAIVDIVAAAAGLHYLEVDGWFCSPLNVGGGTVLCAHGNFPVPAPATADLLQGVPTYSGEPQMELVTPTGAALLRALDPVFGRQPAMRTQTIGYGAGTRDPEGYPNVLRLQIGEREELPGAGLADEAEQAEGSQFERISVLETALDDLSPQLLAHVTERLLAEGALDVMLTPVIMKKGRPGNLITVLAQPADARRFEDFLLRETTTLGVRIREDRRAILEREHVTVDTPYGPIRVKLGIRQGETLNAAPEFEDCRMAAAKFDIPVKQVQQAAIAAYHL